MTNEESTEKTSPARKRRRRKKEHESERFAPCSFALEKYLKEYSSKEELRSYGNALNQTDCIAHQPDSGYHPRAYVWDHTHKRRSGLSVQKGGGSIWGRFLCLKNPNFVVFQFHQGEPIPAHVLAYIQSSWL